MENKSFLKLNIKNVEGGLSLSPAKKDVSSINSSFSDSDCPFLESRQAKRRKYCGRWTSALCLTISLIVSYIVWHTDVIHDAVASRLVLKNGSRLFEVWEKEPVTTTLSVYLFNYTNVQEFEDGIDEKLRVEEVGPYSYTVHTTRENIIFNPNGTVSYQERKTHYYAPHLTNGSLEDMVTVPSIPYMSILDKTKDSYFFTRGLVSGAMDKFGVKPFVSVPAGKFIWGYEDKIVTMAQFADQNLPHDKLGLLVGKNETQKDVITVYTGENNIMKKGYATRVNGESTLDHWSGDDCNRIDGLTTMLIPPFQQDVTTQYLYTKDACRRVPFTYKAQESSRGVPTYRYEIPESFLDYSKEKNRCYCSETCLPSGVLNASACAFGAPILASKPHFLHGDPILLTNVDGLNPNEEMHKSWINIQTDLGLVVDGTTSAQMNIQVSNLYGSTLKNVYKDQMILPVSWIKLSMNQWPSSTQMEVAGLVFLYLSVVTILYYVPLLVAVASLIAIICRQVRRRKEIKAEKAMKKMTIEVAHL